MQHPQVLLVLRTCTWEGRELFSFLESILGNYRPVIPISLSRKFTECKWSVTLMEGGLWDSLLIRALGWQFSDDSWGKAGLRGDLWDWLGCKRKVKRSVDKHKMECSKERSPSFVFEMVVSELMADLQEQDPDRGCDRRCSAVIKTPYQVLEIPKKERE